MATVIGVRFKKAGKVYYFDPCEVWPRPGDSVVVETARGVELGEVVTGAREVADEQIVSPLKKVVRIATEEDVRRAEYNARREAEAFRICQEKVARHKLEMKLVSVEYTFDNSKIIFYFTANGRVDFRELVKDLAGVFKTRIELRQIGVRDEAKMLGGLGSCGRPICCGAFLGDFQPVSIKMAKEQNLSLNPTKISGQCGRLMCCLKYEQEYYEQTLKKLPKVGKDIVTPDGVGVLSEINAIREKVKVRIKIGRRLRRARVRHQRGAQARPGRLRRRARGAQAPPAPRRGRAGAPAKEEEDAAKRRRYHQKAPKNLSTDQFLEKMKTDSDAGKKKDRANKDRSAREKRTAQGEASPSPRTSPRRKQRRRPRQPPPEAKPAGGQAGAGNAERGDRGKARAGAQADGRGQARGRAGRCAG